MSEKLFVGCLAVALSCLTVQADTLTWKASTGGKWSDFANWSSSGTHLVPESGDTIKINNLVSGQTYENDIVGLECPHFELGGSSASPYPKLEGNAITLTGGWDAFAATSGRFDSYIPLVLTVQNGNPTNRFNNAGRLQQVGRISGAGMLLKDGGGIMEVNGGNTYTGGTVLYGNNSGWLDPYVRTSGDNVGSTPMGDPSNVYEIMGGGLSRLNSAFGYETYVHPIATKGINAMDEWFYSGCKSYTGNIRGTRYVAGIDNGTAVTFSGDISVSGALRFQFQNELTNPKVKRKVTVTGRIEAESFNEDIGSVPQDESDVIVLSHADNRIERFYSDFWNTQAGAVNAFGENAVVRFGHAAADRGVLDLSGFDQRINRIALNDKFPLPTEGEHALEGHQLRASYPATLEMRATEDSISDARFEGDLTLVWNPVGAYRFQTYSETGRIMPMTGAIIVSNGVFEVNGTNAFPSVSRVEVADGATFEWSSTCAGRGLLRANRLSLGSKATFVVADGASQPFFPGGAARALAIDMKSDSRLVLRGDAKLMVSELKVGDKTYPAGTVFSAVPGVPGATYLPQLEGSTVTLQVSPIAPYELKPISAKAYVQDGLVCQLDGIENAGRGVHDGRSTVWKDLTGLTGDFAVSNIASFTEKALHKDRAGSMAINRTRRKDIATIEAAVSDCDRAEVNYIMPVYIAQQEYVLFKTVSGLRTFGFDYKHFGWTTEVAPNATTIAVCYTPIGVAKNFYQDAVVPEGALYTGESWSDCDKPKDCMTIGGRCISWAGSDTNPYGYSINAVRFYTRELTPDEVFANYVIDSIRFRDEVPEGATNYRKSAEDESMVECRVSYSTGSGTIKVDGCPATAEGVAWFGSGATVTLTLTPDDGQEFIKWTGDTDAIVSGSATDKSIKVMVDRALSFSAEVSASILVVSESTNLSKDTYCAGIRFLGAYTLASSTGAKITIANGGAGIEVVDGTAGNAVIKCPVVVGIAEGGEEQVVKVPSGATLVQEGLLSGKASLRFTGPGAFRLRNGSNLTGDLTFDDGAAELVGVISDTKGSITLSETSTLTLAGADVGKLVKVNAQKDGYRIVCATRTTNYLRSGYRQLAYSNTPVWGMQVESGAELTIEKSYNGEGSAGIYPKFAGAGVVNMRTDTDKIACLTINSSIGLHVWKPLYKSVRSNYNRINNGAKMYLECENALTKSPWCFRGFVDLCGLDQTCGRFSYVSDDGGSGAKPFKNYNTGVIHSDAPATLTVFQDDNAAGGGNSGAQVFTGKFTGRASFVRTGDTSKSDDVMRNNDLILGATSTSTGAVSATWGLLSFANFTTNSAGAAYVLCGSWPNCTELSASGKGTIELGHSKAVGKKTDVRIGEGGKLRLLPGVKQRIRYLYLPTGEDGALELQTTCRTYGSSASDADVKLDAYFEGAGVINSRGENPGVAILIR